MRLKVALAVLLLIPAVKATELKPVLNYVGWVRQ